MKPKIAISEVIIQFGYAGTDETSDIKIKVDTEGGGNFVKVQDIMAQNGDGITFDIKELAFVTDVAAYLCEDKNDIIAPKINAEEWLKQFKEMVK